ncbi:MAG: hypothetical protein Q8Q51_09675 [Lutibacter sp.]|nr:hypothetical protein [Lutibacter sp.]
MKKLSFLAVLALLIMFGCSKEEMTNTEQELFSVEKNNQSIFNNDQSGKPVSTVSEIRFVSNSIENGNFIEDGCLISPYNPPLIRRLLEEGMFSGSIEGYGNINPKISKYQIVGCDIALNDGGINRQIEPEYVEANMYKLTIVGKISLSPRDYFTIQISGNVYPISYTEAAGGPHAWINFDGGNFEGIGTVNTVSGKLNGLLYKEFRVYGLIWRGINDFRNGKMYLDITDQY